MQEIGVQLVVVFGVLGVCFAGPGIALYFVSRRKRLARARRRSPLGISLLRGPGHSLREELDALTYDLGADVMALMLAPLLILALLLASGQLQGKAAMLRVAPFFAVAVVGFIVYFTRKLLKIGARLDNLRAGYDAEVAVGQELDQLMREGAAVFHDLPADNFNIDHVVIARQGVFAVETKGFTKPNRNRGREDAKVVFDGHSLQFPTWTTREPLEQAERQAAWLGKWLSAAIDSPVRALPVVALPGWFVERKGRGDVRVYSGRELAEMLRARGARPVADHDLERIVHRVDERCRTVAPRYADTAKSG